MKNKSDNHFNLQKYTINSSVNKMKFSKAFNAVCIYRHLRSVSEIKFVFFSNFKLF